jgi:ABC-2 type transport system ATP-binding protein
MDKFGISILEDKQYRMLSVGQKRRLHLALALAHDPEILILDEPTAGLDVEGRNDLHKEIQVLNAEGLTVILASHDMAEVESLCHKVGVMVEGEMKFYGSKEDFVNTKGDTKYIKLKTDQDEIFKDYRSTSYEFINQSNEGMLLKTLNILETMVEISDYALKKNIHINSISTDSLSIEERFMDLITNKRKEKNEKVIL